MAFKLRPALTGRLLLVVTLAVLAGVLPLSITAAQAPAPKSTALINLSFKGVTTPAANVELIQAVVDYDPGAKDPKNTLQAPRVFTVVEGELTVQVGANTGTYATGKGAPVPAGVAVTFSNESTTAKARVFVSALLPAGIGDPVVEPGGVAPALRPKATFTSRLPLYGLPAVVDLTQQGTRYDVGYTTPNHVMNQPHLQTITEGECSYTYFDGQKETYGPGAQVQMYVGRPGNMATAGQVACAFLMTWVTTPGQPNTVAPPAAAPAAAPAPPSVGTGLEPGVGTTDGWFDPLALTTLGLSVLVLSGFAFRFSRGTRRRAR